MTNSWLSICIAASTAFLMGNSPDLEIKELKNLFGLFVHSSGVLTTLPANNNPHVEAFTKRLSALFKWSIHLPSESFSEIIRSLVFLSGILKTDSAKHIKPTPSLLSKPYSLKKASSIVLSFLLALQASIICFALLEIVSVFRKAESSISFGTIDDSAVNLLSEKNISTILILWHQVATF